MRINWAERVAAAAAAAGCAVSPGHFCVCARVVFAVTELKFFCAACVCVCVWTRRLASASSPDWCDLSPPPPGL